MTTTTECASVLLLADLPATDAGFNRRLQKWGCKFIGGGAYGHVYSHPTHCDRVSKTGGYKSDGWPLFAMFAAGCVNPHLPRIYSFQWVTDADGEPVYYVAEVERLTYTITQARFTATDERIKARATLLYDALCRCGDVAFTAKGLRACDENGAADLLDHMARLFPISAWDLHSGNWMLRGDGTMVLTDPWSVSEHPSRLSFRMVA